MIANDVHCVSGGRLKLLFEMYFCFLKMGSISFGGGYAMIPFFEEEIVNKKHWIKKEKIIDIFAIAESLPGAIGLNSAGLVGYDIAGMRGTLTALLGTLTPSVIIVLLFSVLFQKYSSSPMVQAAFYGIRPAIVSLIFFAAYKIGKVSVRNSVCALIAALAFAAIMFAHLHPILIIVLGAGLGIIAKKLNI